MVKEVCREHCLVCCTILHWCQHYKVGHESFKKLSWPEQVHLTMIVAMDDLVYQNHQITLCEIGSELLISKGAVHNIICKKFIYGKICSQWMYMNRSSHIHRSSHWREWVFVWPILWGSWSKVRISLQRLWHVIRLTHHFDFAFKCISMEWCHPYSPSPKRSSSFCHEAWKSDAQFLFNLYSLTDFNEVTLNGITSCCWSLNWMSRVSARRSSQHG